MEETQSLREQIAEDMALLPQLPADSIPLDPPQELSCPACGEEKEVEDCCGNCCDSDCQCF